MLFRHSVKMAKLVDTSLKVGTSCIISGPSGSGKTQLLLRCLHPDNQEAVFGQRVSKIFLIYSIWQHAYDSLKAQNPETKFIQDFSQVPDLKEPHIVIWDDMQLSMQTNKKIKQQITDCFFRLAHHKLMWNIVVFQTLFNHGLRNCVLNAHYQVIFPVKADMSQLNYLSKQMFPDLDAHFLQSCLVDASKDKHGFIFIDRNSDPYVRNFVYPTLNAKIYHGVSQKTDKSKKQASN